MKMKKIIPMVMMATLPTVGMAQDGSGLFEKNFDRSVKPQDDFYQFATGGWQKNNPLSFRQLRPVARKQQQAY